MILRKLMQLVDNSEKIFDLFLLVIITSVCVLWIVEEALEVIFDYDRYGYMVTLVVLPACFCLSYFFKKVQIARVAVFLYLVLYLLFLTVITFSEAANSGTIYTMASTLQWVPVIYIVSFLFLPNKQAILSAIGIYCMMLVLLFLAHADIFALKNTVLQAILFNAALSQGVCIFCLFGVVKLKISKDESTLRADKMEKAANIDGLLGIGNRRMLQEHLTRMADGQTPFSLLLIDIDQFKAINDTHGHLVGDDILRELTANMEKSLRPEDTIGRWGGEEFLVIAKGADLANAEVLAQRIRSEVAEQVFSTVGRVTVSIGVAKFETNASVSHTFSIADKALYQAKNAGRNKVVVGK